MGINSNNGVTPEVLYQQFLDALNDSGIGGGGGGVNTSRQPVSIVEHTDSYVVPVGFFARVIPIDTIVRKETSISSAGHLYLGLTIDTEEAFPVLNFFATDFDGDGASNESWILVEASGYARWWSNLTGIRLARMNKTYVTSTNLPSGSILQSISSTTDDQNETWVQKRDAFQIAGSSNHNADIMCSIEPNTPLVKEFWCPAGTVLDTGQGNGSSFNMKYKVELYEEQV